MIGLQMSLQKLIEETQMPLKYDPEWQNELDKVSERVLRNNRQFWWISFVATGVILCGLLWLLSRFGMSQAYVISGTIVVASLCLVAVINSAVTTIHASLALLTATVEWVGRKQLGEYEPSDTIR